MPEQERDAFLGELSGLLTDNGVFTQYHYLHGMQVQNGQLGRFDMTRLLHRHFGSVERTIVLAKSPARVRFRLPQPPAHANASNSCQWKDWLDPRSSGNPFDSSPLRLGIRLGEEIMNKRWLLALGARAVFGGHRCRR